MLAHGWGRGLKDVGDQALMRGLATAFPSMRPGLSLPYGGRRLIAGHKASDGSSPAVVPPPPMREGCVVWRTSLSGLRLPTHRPHEADELTGDCRADHGCPLAAPA